MRAWDRAVGGLARRVVARPPPEHTIAARLLGVVDPETGAPLSLERLKGELSVVYIAVRLGCC